MATARACITPPIISTTRRSCTAPRSGSSWWRIRSAHDPEKCAAVFPRDKRRRRLRGDHAQTVSSPHMTKIRVGLVGCGFVAELHMYAYRRVYGVDVEVSAVA